MIQAWMLAISQARNNYKGALKLWGLVGEPRTKDASRS